MGAAAFSSGDFYKMIEKSLIDRAFPESKSLDQEMPTPDKLGINIPTL